MGGFACVVFIAIIFVFSEKIVMVFSVAVECELERIPCLEMCGGEFWIDFEDVFKDGEKFVLFRILEDGVGFVFCVYGVGVDVV